MMHWILACQLVLTWMNVCLCYKPDIEGKIVTKEGLIGGVVSLPCDVTTNISGDALDLLVWYKNETAIYSYDVSLDPTSRHWSVERGRQSLMLGERSSLEVRDLRESDDALYYCRAEFRLSPTRNTAVRLSVIILPNKPFFMNEMGMTVEKRVGPFHEGDNLILSCLVVGGKPPPSISWWQGPALLDRSDGASEVPGVRENSLFLPLVRQHGNTHIRCQADNNNVTEPLYSELYLELYVSPESVTIWSSEQPFSEGHIYSLPCFVNGSYPEPVISWYLDDKLITNEYKITTSTNTNGSLSTLHMSADRTDNGRRLTCAAHNPLMAPDDGTKRYTIPINVFYKPVVNIVPADVISQNLTVEWQTVNLRCEVDANPPVLTLKWLFNGDNIVEIFRNVNVTGKDLSIQNISRLQSGRYTCEVQNLEGTSQSLNFELLVNYIPHCYANRTELIYVTPTTLKCIVDSVPPAAEYVWTFRSIKSGYTEKINTADVSLMNLTSVAVDSTLDEPFALQCQARNEVGLQEAACAVLVEPHFLRPERSALCDISEQNESLLIDCKAVNNVTQYVYAVWRLSESNKTMILIHNVSSAYSYLKIEDFSIESGDEVEVAACNRFGCGVSFRLRPSPMLLAGKAPAPWWRWHTFLQRDVWMSIGIIIIILLFILSTLILRKIINKHTKSRNRKQTQVIQLLQLSETRTRGYIDVVERRTDRGSTLLTNRNSIGIVCSEINDMQKKDEEPPPVNRRIKPKKRKNFKESKQKKSRGVMTNGDVGLTLLKCQCGDGTSLVAPDITSQVDANRVLYSDYNVSTLNKESAV